MKTLKETIAKIKFGDAICVQNLAVLPVMGESTEAEYLTLDDAMALGLATVRETEGGGSVPELLFINKGEVPVFLLDGEELIGANQNRVLNLSMMVAAHQTVRIPVSCVEAGRWSHSTRHFMASDHTHFAEGRRRKAAQVSESLVHTGSRASDQSEVWHSIHDKARRMESSSPTGAMRDIFEIHRTSVQDYVEGLPPVQGQVGALFAIDGRISGLDLFDKHDTLAKLLPKLVRSYAIDAIDSLRHSRSRKDPPDRESANRFAEKIALAPCGKFDAVGMGTDIRIVSDDLAGGALEVDGCVVHLGVFHLEQGDKVPQWLASRVARASARRANRRG